VGTLANPVVAPMMKSKPKSQRRDRGQNALYQRKDGFWVASVSLGTDADGKRIRRDFYARTKREALAKVTDETARAGGCITAAPKAGTVGEWFETWLGEVKASRQPTTAATYKAIWDKHGNPLIGKRRLSRFGATDVAWLYSRLTEREVGGAAIAKLHVILHRGLEVARQRRVFIGENPAGLVDPPRHSAKERQALTVPQVQKLLKSARGDRFEAAIVLAVALGLRRGEILALKWTDVDLKARTIQVRRTLQEVGGHFTLSEGKTTTARRKLTLGKLTLDALRQRKAAAEREGHESPYVFTTYEGTFVSASALRQRHFKPLLETAKLPDIPFHALRHTFATVALERGVATKVAQEALGHASPAITARLYQHVTGDLQRMATAAVDKALSPRTARPSPK